MTDKITIAGLLPEEIAELIKDQPLFRNRQIYQWILSGATTFSEMNSLPAALREQLEEKFCIVPGKVVSELKDHERTVKLAAELDDGSVIECVLLSDEEGRKTACLSTQAGCPMGCIFCKTGSLRFRRNLSAAEISGQLLFLLHREPKISNIVIMGMGEPLLNLEALRKSLAFFMHSSGLNISKRRITISTCGQEKGIIDIADNGPDVRLALSLTTARQDLRVRLMPVSRDNPLPRIKNALLYFQKKRKQQITLEMVLLSGINTGPEEAFAVGEFARSLDAVINLIPWNPVEGLKFDSSELKTPPTAEINAFTGMLKNRGLRVTQRFEKGRKISAACGQLGVVNP